MKILLQKPAILQFQGEGYSPLYATVSALLSIMATVFKSQRILLLYNQIHIHLFICLIYYFVFFERIERTHYREVDIVCLCTFRDTQSQQ